MKIKNMVEYVPLDQLRELPGNPRTITAVQFQKLTESIQANPDYFEARPLIVSDRTGENIVLAGNQRLKACRKLGMESAPAVVLHGLTEEREREIIIRDNVENGEWDIDELANSWDIGELVDWGVNLDFGSSDQKETAEDIVPKPPEEPKAKPGDIYRLGGHRLMCGDSTNKQDVAKLLNGNKVSMVFADPPYGMKKESEGVENDNLNYDDLLAFNKKWIPLSIDSLKENGSWYCWGVDEPLMDIYSEILKPLKKNGAITFRNLITWDKGNGEGQLSESFRKYAPADEKCLFVMLGVQGFNTNADNYYEAWEPIRLYLLEQRQKCGWDVPTMKRVAGHSDMFRDHWTSKSQWDLPTQEVYMKFQQWARDNHVDAFKKDYDEIKKDYDEIKKDYYSTRAYFDNTHDNMNSVWHFSRTAGEEKNETGGHATPKPVALCGRTIKTSTRDGESVLDLFGGSGSTLIACEQLGRRCFMMELSPKYIDVIIKRWENLTGTKAERLTQ